MTFNSPLCFRVYFVIFAEVGTTEAEEWEDYKTIVYETQSIKKFAISLAIFFVRFCFDH